jgi:hypothetical protein
MNRNEIRRSIVAAGYRASLRVILDDLNHPERRGLSLKDFAAVVWLHLSADQFHTFTNVLTGLDSGNINVSEIDLIGMDEDRSEEPR